MARDRVQARKGGLRTVRTGLKGDFFWALFVGQEPHAPSVKSPCPLRSKREPIQSIYLFRGRVEGQLVVLLVGAADGDVVEQQRGREDGLGDFAGVVGDPEIFAGRLDARAKGALSRSERRAPRTSSRVPSGDDAIEQAGIHAVRRES